MVKKIAGTFMKSLMNLPKLVIIALLGGIIALGLGFTTGMITNLFSVVGDLGVSIIATILALVVFSIAMGINEKFSIVKDLIPILIVSPLVATILIALNLTGIPVVSSSVEIGASLGITLVSVIFANNVIKQLNLFK